MEYVYYAPTVLWLLDFFKAVVLGVLVTAPVGPVGAMVIRRSLKSGFWLGVVSGLGAALADTLFAWLAVMGVGAVERFVSQYEIWIGAVGSVLLVGMGLWSMRQPSPISLDIPNPADGGDSKQIKPLAAQNNCARTSVGEESWFRSALGTFGITITNPVTIVGFAGVFTVFGLGTSVAQSPWHAAVVTLGVFCGAMFWWSGLAALMAWLGPKFSTKTTHRIHRITAWIVLLSGIFVAVRTVIKA
jgi:putative LysE/RhtB family amino acid efflux pump